MNRYGMLSRTYTLYFDYELERGDETWDVEVTYETDGRENYCGLVGLCGNRIDL